MVLDGWLYALTKEAVQSCAPMPQGSPLRWVHPPRGSGPLFKLRAWPILQCWWASCYAASALSRRAWIASRTP